MTAAAVAAVAEQTAAAAAAVAEAEAAAVAATTVTATVAQFVGEGESGAAGDTTVVGIPVGSEAFSSGGGAGGGLEGQGGRGDGQSPVRDVAVMVQPHTSGTPSVPTAAAAAAIEAASEVVNVARTKPIIL